MPFVNDARGEVGLLGQAPRTLNIECTDNTDNTDVYKEVGEELPMIPGALITDQYLWGLRYFTHYPLLIIH